VEKAKEATEGATFARNEYEKWSNAWKDAKKSLEETVKRHDIDRAALADERKLIKMIMRMIGKRLCTTRVLLLGCFEGIFAGVCAVALECFCWS
jgi:hypothetical protein